ncbi:MAG: hypothetical protein RIK87_18590 [Fuerstiella sp.]
MSRSKVPKLLSLLYTHNPFYLISACLFVYGLKLLFRAGDSAVLFQRGSVAYMEPWGLLASFAAVTVLMGVTAILIVRLGRVWEDARSLVLIVLLMLLAMSVSADEILTVLSDRDTSQQHLLVMFGVGIGFALGMGELLIKGLKIRFGPGYRLPLYGFLVLFFLWPGLLLPELTGFSKEQTRWLIVAFPMVATAVTLTLIPAIRKGATAVADNGTPWTWPLFPWTPFVFIAVAVCFRSYSLTMSFDALPSNGHYWDTTFGLYQLVPLLLSVLVVLLEIGIVEQKPKLQRGILLTAPMLLVPAYPWLVPWSRLPAYSTFTYTVVDQIASPVFLAVIGLGLLYGYAWYRGLRHGEIGFHSMVVLCGLFGPRAFGSRIWQLDAEQITWWPLLGSAIVLLAAGVMRRQSLRTFTGLLLIILTAHQTMSTVPELQGWRTFMVLHAIFASVLAVGFAFRDDFAKTVAELGPPALSITMFAGLVTLSRQNAGRVPVVGYAAGFTLLAFALYYLIHNRHYLMAALLHCGVGLIGGIGLGIYAFSRATLPEGVKPVILGLGSFIVAVFISVLKSGLSRRLRVCWLTRRRAEGL